jgi:hypothetical protein
MRITKCLIICKTALLGACGSASQERIDYAAFAKGTATQSFTVEGWEVILTSAKIGFGPAYFCTTAAANQDLCPSAIAELQTSTTVDALDSVPQRIGTIHGLTGRMHSVGYDFAISWFPRMNTATATTGAPGGHSARFEGRAVKAGVTLSFVADVDVTPKNQGALAVQGPALDVEVNGSDVALTIGFDAAAICQGVDFDELAKLAGGSGSLAVAKDSRAFNALVFGLTVGAPPTFSWR